MKFILPLLYSCGPIYSRPVAVLVIYCCFVGAAVAQADSVNVDSMRSTPDSLATIVFFRPRFGQGLLVEYNLYQDSTLIGPIKVGSLYKVLCKPGLNTFWAKTEKKITYEINLKPGTVRYVKCRVSMGWTDGRPSFVEVNEIEGKDAIMKFNMKGDPKK